MMAQILAARQKMSKGGGKGKKKKTGKKGK